MQKPLLVRADWDEEAQVWVTESDEVPGLATEAATVEALITKLKDMIPELLELNGVPGDGEIAFEHFIRGFDTAQRAAA
jgi:predicted RNase H-like HicB family nuclease